MAYFSLTIILVLVLKISAIYTHPDISGMRTPPHLHYLLTIHNYNASFFQAAKKPELERTE